MGILGASWSLKGDLRFENHTYTDYFVSQRSKYWLHFPSPDIINVLKRPNF